MNTFGKLFNKGNSEPEISSICALHNLLAIGFSNGVLILLDIEKMDICFSNKVKNNFINTNSISLRMIDLLLS